MYHYVRDFGRNRYPAIKGLDTELFRKQLIFLKTNFNIVRMEDVISTLSGGEDLPHNAVLLTFDDGYIDHYTTVFPVLDEIGIQGSFFPPSMILETNLLLDVNKIHFTLATGETSLVYELLLKEIEFYRGSEYEIPETQVLLRDYAVSDCFDSGEVVFIKHMLQTVLPERLRCIIADKMFRRFVGVEETTFARELYCDIAQLTTMKNHGMFIGLHGSSHGWLGNMKEIDYELDVRRALDFMDNVGLIDKKAWVMNYPYGSWSNGVVNFIRKNNCRLGLTTKVGVADLRVDDLLLLPRLDTNDFYPKSDNYLKFQKSIA